MSLRQGASLFIVLIAAALVGGTVATPWAAQARPAPGFAEQPPAAADPGQIADGLVSDEQALRNPSSPEPVLAAAARRQQLTYRELGRNPALAAAARTRVPASLLFVYDQNVAARQQLTAMSVPHDTLPAWHITAPTPADALMSYYREAEAASGVGWNYLAAINLIETVFGRIAGLSTAGAQGPMQFMPGTWAAYGGGGDINSPRDSILAAGRYLAASGFAADRDGAIWRYNNSSQYVAAVNAYAAALAADPAAFAGYYRWDVYYYSTSGDVLLPVGYSQPSRIPVADYLARQPR